MLHDSLGKLTKNKHILVPLWIKRQANKSDINDSSALENERAKTLTIRRERWRFVLAYNSAALCQIIVFVVIEQNYVCRTNQKWDIRWSNLIFDANYLWEYWTKSNIQLTHKLCYQIFCGPIETVKWSLPESLSFQPLWPMFTL